ncbi:SET domain-containing protein [Annulohypoxylon maeteangense]|uniref:SET domain-containing protein n=1 Tax=Annulohypoxylon maeteangense TaxID=1927788 RepID=UPI0020073CA1|nr:SET domain-containing protein [Annulohypoxylon maeteangense]KAI0889042.1 SET domain-containing protein [Annulohypoxylon maeteangense]
MNISGDTEHSFEHIHLHPPPSRVWAPRAAMGIDAGFDMVPRLSNDTGDIEKWARFIDQIRDTYRGDAQVLIKPCCITFEAGEHPRLPFEGHKFLRFSSKVSGRTAEATGVRKYIREVTVIAKAHFGSRIRNWDEGIDRFGVYRWDVVHESMASYEKPADPKVSPAIVIPPKEPGVPLYLVTEVTGRGKGLVALFHIPAGTRLLCEKPLFTVNNMPPDELEICIAAKLKVLSKGEQRQFLSLHNNYRGRYPFSGIVKTNALPCGPSSPVGGVYPTICLINHSCLPNSHNNWNDNERHETIHATRPIQAGEEITISYDRGGKAHTRRAFLRKAFGFDCSCSGCSLQPPELKASDSRRQSIQDLDAAIGDLHQMAHKPTEILRKCRALFQVLEEEFKGYAWPPKAKLYYDAFQVSIAHGDEARASLFAERAYEARVICEGEDSPETRKKKSLALKPRDHNAYGLYSMKWKSERNMIPKGLSTEQLEKWLWRE